MWFVGLARQRSMLDVTCAVAKGGPGKPCLELQDALQQLPPEIHHKMLPASRAVAMRRTSTTLRTAVEKADAVVQVRQGKQTEGFDGQGLMDKLNSLNAWCKVIVLRLKDCRLGRAGAVSLAEALASFLSASLADLDLEGNDIQEGGVRALAETLRLNTTLTSLNLSVNDLGEGGGRALAETLRVNTTVTSLDLGWNDLGEGGGLALAETLRLNTTLTSLNLSVNHLEEVGGRALAETLRVNTTLTSLDLSLNDLGEGGGRALAETLRLNTTLTWLNLCSNDLGEEQESALWHAWEDRGGSLRV